MAQSEIDQSAQALSDRARTSLRNTSNALWDVLVDLWHPEHNPGGFVTLGVADNPLMQEQLLHHMNSTFDLPDRYLLLGDTITGSARLKTAVAHFLNRHLKPSRPLESSQIIATNGVSSAIEHCSWALCDPGEGILVGRPFYRGFNRDICLRPGSKLMPVTFDGLDPLSPSAVVKYEEAITNSRSRGCTIRAIMLSNPHNPLGRCYPRSFLISLMSMCQKYSVHIISDEIYALSIWRHGQDGTIAMQEFTSVLSLNLDGLIDPSLVHALWGVSKDFGANGIRLGIIISQGNRSFLESIRGAGQYSSISGLADYCTTKILEDEEFTDQYIEKNREMLAKSYSYVIAFLRDHKIPYAPRSNSGFFIWCDLLAAYLESHPEKSECDKKSITRELENKLALYKVHLGCGDDFGTEQPGWFRLTFSQHQEQLDEGLRRIVQALRS